MNTKEMRQALRDAGHHVPRSNEETIDAYNKAFGDDSTQYGESTMEPVQAVQDQINIAKTNVVKLASSNIWTYIGSGDTPPHLINFMGMQKFIRGQPVEVTNQTVIDKLKNNPCFVKGKVDQELLFKRDEEARERAEKQRFEDLKLQIETERAMG